MNFWFLLFDDCSSQLYARWTVHRSYSHVVMMLIFKQKNYLIKYCSLWWLLYIEDDYCVIYSNTDDMDAFSRAGLKLRLIRKLSYAYLLETLLIVDPGRISLLLCRSQQVNMWCKIVGLFPSNQSVTFTTICVPHFSVFHPLQRRRLSPRKIGSLLTVWTEIDQ